MSASERDIRSVTENDEITRQLNQIKFDIRDEVVSVVEDDEYVDTSFNQTYEEWVEDVRDVKQELQHLVRTESKDSPLEKAEEMIEEHIIDPYITNMAENGPYIPGYKVEPTLESEHDAIIISGELQATYLEDIENLYNTIQSMEAQREFQKPEFVDYRNIV